MDLFLAGKRALITGASKGIGRATALMLAEEGCDLVLVSRTAETLQAAADAIRARHQVAVDVIPADLSRQTEVERVATVAGPLDILVNNAGTSHTAPLLDQTEEDYDRIINTNQKGAWLVAIEVARAMRDRKIAGSIINIASITGVRPTNWAAPYAISKAALLHMTRQMGSELARYGIRVNALAPGFFATDLNRDFLYSDVGQALVKRVPMRRLGAYEDLDGPFLLLASDASRFMTGSVLTLDGGHSINSL